MTKSRVSPTVMDPSKSPPLLMALLLLRITCRADNDTSRINIGLLTGQTGIGLDDQEISGLIPDESDITLKSIPAPSNVMTSVKDVCQAVSSGEIISIVSMASCDSVGFTSSLLARSAVPSVLLYPRQCPPPLTEGGLAIRRAVGRTHPVDAIQHIVITNQWTKMFIFYDSNSVMLFSDVMSRLSTHGIVASVFEVDSEADVEKYIPLTVRLPDYSYPYLLLCGDVMTEIILRKAAMYNLREYEYKWIVYNQGMMSSDFADILTVSDNIIIVEDSAQEELEQEAKTLIQSSMESIRETGATRTEDGSFDQKSPPASAKGKCISPLSLDVKKDIATDLQASLPESDSSIDQYTVKSSIQRYDATPHFEKTGDISVDGILDQLDDDFYINKFDGFNGRHFIFGSIEYSFFQFKEELLPNGNWRWNGLVFELMDELARVLNFTYETIEVPDGSFGIQDADGNWDGLIGMVHRKEIDIAASVFSITAQRKTAVDFCTHIFYEESAVILRKPDEEEKLLLFFKPYKWQVWAIIIGAVLLCGTVTWLVTVLSPLYKKPKQRERSNFKDGLFQLRNTIMYFYGAFVQQGGIWLPLAQSGRILVGCFWFSCLVLVATYTGNLISFLAVSRVQLPFDNLLDMSRQRAVKWGTPTGVALLQLFEESTIEPYVSIAEGNDPSATYGEGLRRVKEEDYAFIAEKSWYHAEAAKDCRLAMLRETFFPTNYGMAFRKDVPYLKIFDDIIIKLKEAGILKRWTEKWTPQNLNCVGLKAVTTAKVVSLNEFQGDLYILCIGLGAAMLVFGVEMLSKGCRAKPENEGNGGGEVEENRDAKTIDGLSSSFDRSPPYPSE